MSAPIGEVLHMGRRFRNWPLAVPTIYRTVVFSLLVLLFKFAEHIVGALIHGKTISDGIAALLSEGLGTMLAEYVLIIAAFLPFFTVKEIEHAFGPEKVRACFSASVWMGLILTLRTKLSRQERYHDRQPRNHIAITGTGGSCK